MNHIHSLLHSCDSKVRARYFSRPNIASFLQLLVRIFFLQILQIAVIIHTTPYSARKSTEYILEGLNSVLSLAFNQKWNLEKEMSITRTSHSSSIKQTNKKQPKRTGIIAFCLPPKMGHFNAKMTQQHNVLKSKLLYICERSCLSKDIYVYYFIFILRAICHQYLSSSAKCIKIKKK